MSYTVTLMVSEETLLMLSLKSVVVGLGYAPTSNRLDAMAEGTMGSTLTTTGAGVSVPLANPDPIYTCDGKDTQPALLLAVMPYRFGVNPLNTPVRLVKAEPLMLKLLPNTVEVTFIVPVPTVVVGWVTFKVGAEGVAGCTFTTTLLADDEQPSALMGVKKMLYVLEADPLGMLYPALLMALRL